MRLPEFLPGDLCISNSKLYGMQLYELTYPGRSAGSAKWGLVITGPVYFDSRVAGLRRLKKAPAFWDSADKMYVLLTSMGVCVAWAHTMERFDDTR